MELTGIINKPLLLHLVGCLYYLYQWCTVKRISDNEIYLLIKYIKSVLWIVAKCLSYIEQARCPKVKKICAPSWFYLQDYTRMHVQQNIKFYERLSVTITFSTWVTRNENFKNKWGLSACLEWVGFFSSLSQCGDGANRARLEASCCLNVVLLITQWTQVHLSATVITNTYCYYNSMFKYKIKTHSLFLSLSLTHSLPSLLSLTLPFSHSLWGRLDLWSH